MAITVTPEPGEQTATVGEESNFGLGSFTDSEPTPELRWFVGIDWGDGQTSNIEVGTDGNLPSELHTYNTAGSKTVTLTISNGEAQGQGMFAVSVTGTGGGGGGGAANTITATVHVIDQDGNPVNNATVRLEPDAVNFVAATTNASGVATFNNFTPSVSRLLVTVNQTTWVFGHNFRTASTVRVGINLILPAAGGGRGNGAFSWQKITVKDTDDVAIAEAKVYGYPTENIQNPILPSGKPTYPWYSSSATGESIEVQTTDSSGVAFIKCGDPNISHQVVVVKTGYIPHIETMAIGAMGSDSVIKLGTPPAVHGTGDLAILVTAGISLSEQQSAPIQDAQTAIAWLTPDVNDSTTVRAGPIQMFPISRSTLMGIMYGTYDSSYRFRMSSPHFDLRTTSNGLASDGISFTTPASIAGNWPEYPLSVNIGRKVTGTTGTTTKEVSVQVAGAGGSVLSTSYRVQGWLTTTAGGERRIGREVSLFRTRSQPFPTNTLAFTDLPDGTYYLWVVADGFKPLKAEEFTVPGVGQTVSMHPYRQDAVPRANSAEKQPMTFRSNLGTFVCAVDRRREMGLPPFTVAGPLNPTPAGLLVITLNDAHVILSSDFANAVEGP